MTFYEWFSYSIEARVLLALSCAMGFVGWYYLSKRTGR